ncbi:MAG: DJ-1/PfpI family protein [Chloroflexi bacterium]|nr:DJ-1/PfpI family protein [Chloroflexota bacterium]
MAIHHFSEAASRIVLVFGHFLQQATFSHVKYKKVLDHQACDMTTADFKNKVLILLAPGFEEAEVIPCMTQLRKASLPVSLVGLTSGQVTGWHGLSICPDVALDEVGDYGALKLVVIPGGRQCATMLLIDPRVHRLLNTVIEQEGRVGVMRTAVPITTQSGLLPTSMDVHFVLQNRENIDGFVAELLRLMLNDSVVRND